MTTLVSSRAPRGTTELNRVGITERFANGESAASIARSLDMDKTSVMKRLRLWGRGSKDVSRMHMDFGADLTSETLSYVAGLFDGEGCILVGSGRRAPGYMNVSLSNTHYPVVEQLQSWFGGSLFEKRSKNPKHRPVLMWSMRGAKAGLFLALVEPYLVVKKEQANAAIIYAETLSWDFHGRRVGEDAMRLRDMATRKCRALKWVSGQRKED